MRTRSGDKRRSILDAALHVFARDGFDGAKVSSIAATASVATGSVYLYFQGKENILETIFGSFWKQLRQNIEAITEPQPLERIRQELQLFFDTLAQNREFALIYLREHHRFTDRRPAGYEDYERCLELGLLAYREAAVKQFDANRFAASVAILFGGVRAALEFWLEHDTSLSMVREHMLKMSMAGITVMAKEET